MRLGMTLAFLSGLIFVTAAANGQGLTYVRSIYFSEAGFGNVQPLGGAVSLFLTSFGNVTDPLDPSNGLKPLAFDLTDNPEIRVTPQAGDVVVLDTGGGVSDLWRFTPAGLLVVYSAVDPGKPLLPADVGIPASRQSTMLTVYEASLFQNPFGDTPELAYLPGPGQPGYLANNIVLPTDPPAVTYTTDAFDVPEPTTLAGCGMAFGLAALLRRRRG